MLTGFTYTIMQNIMKMFHRAMKIRKYRKLSRNSLMLSPRIQTYVTVLYSSCSVDLFLNNAITPVVSGLDSSPNPWDSFLWLQNIRFTKLFMIVVVIIVIQPTLKMNIMAEFWKNTHSLKFSTAPAFTSKVLQNTDTKLMTRNCYFTVS